MSSQSAMFDGIFAKLTADQTAGTLYDDLSGNIFRYQAPQTKAMPLLLINVITDPPWRFFASSDIEAVIQFDIYSPRPEGSTSISELSDKLFTLIDNAALTITGFVGAKMHIDQRGVYTTEEDSLRVRIEARLWANVA